MQKSIFLLGYVKDFRLLLEIVLILGYNERISMNAAFLRTCRLLADRHILRRLCECNEHRETEGFEVSVHAGGRKRRFL